MPNIAQVLKSEISRLAKKEAKQLTRDVKKSSAYLKRAMADLKRRIGSLEKQSKWLAKEAHKTQLALPTAAPEQADKARITAKGIRSLRRKLRLSQAEFGKLVGVTTGAVNIWEHKGSGALRLREKTLAGILSLRGIGARDARTRLESSRPNVAKVKKVSKKTTRKPGKAVRAGRKPAARKNA